MVGAAPLVPDRTICNPINDFRLGGVALIDTSLRFVVSDVLSPLQHGTLNGARLDSFGGKRKECWSTAQPSVRLIITQHSNHSRGVPLSPTKSSQLYRTTAKCYGDSIQTTVKEISKQLNKYDTSRKGH